MDKKTDKGFKLSYSKLSYRRRFYRDLWTAPINIFLSILIYMGTKSLILSSIVMLLSISSIAYNYFLWKKEINN